MGLVFQYGSNASRGRLNGPRRLNGHASVQGPAETVDDYDICFDIESKTNAASDLVPVNGRKAWGVLYEIPDEFIRGERSDGQKTLAQIEGPRYEEKDILVRRPNGAVAQAMTFLVRPGERKSGLMTGVWYVSWIVYGLREQGVSEPYIAHVIEVALATNAGAGDPGEAERAHPEPLTPVAIRCRPGSGFRKNQGVLLGQSVLAGKRPNRGALSQFFDTDFWPSS